MAAPEGRDHLPEGDQSRHTHAALIRFYAPLTRDLAERASAAFKATGDTFLTQYEEVYRSEYGRWQHYEPEDWHPTFERPTLGDFYTSRWSTRNLDRMPIGAYPEFSARLAAVTGSMNKVVGEWEKDAGNDMRLHMRDSREDALLLTSGTILGYVYNVDAGSSGVARSVYRTLHVSITSLGQSLALLTFESVAGFEDPLDLAAAIVRDGVLDEFALLLPPNLLGPGCREGWGLPGPMIETDGKGHVSLHRDFRELLTKEKQLYNDDLLSKPGARHEGRGQAGRGCPMARHSPKGVSPISELADVFLERLRTQVVRTSPSRPGVGVDW